MFRRLVQLDDTEIPVENVNVKNLIYSCRSMEFSCCAMHNKNVTNTPKPESKKMRFDQKKEISCISSPVMDWILEISYDYISSYPRKEVVPIDAHRMFIWTWFVHLRKQEGLLTSECILKVLLIWFFSVVLITTSKNRYKLVSSFFCCPTFVSSESMLKILLHSRLMQNLVWICIKIVLYKGYNEFSIAWLGK